VALQDILTGLVSCLFRFESSVVETKRHDYWREIGLNEKMVERVLVLGARLEWYWSPVSGFFYDWKDLFQFSEVFKDRYASLGYGIYDSSFSDGSFLDEVLFYQEV
jgi:hypothetical protein